MAVRKKTKVFFLTPTKKLKLRMACGLEKDVRGSEKREAVKKEKPKANVLSKRKEKSHTRTLFGG